MDDTDSVTVEKVVFSSSEEMFEIPLHGVKTSLGDLMATCQLIIDMWYLEDEIPTAIIIPLPC